ncbi:putative DNA endonuclease SmrA [Saliniradius amylolyticus]|uniref:Putative DNA endonuclease SmrA n=1 Tax=Saliniradius amylolyticus TaxID=2183582 RepID=A0A2S2E6T3_9ALTE|nr:DNA endonuclease SmrA [Saliniradius amylolyticus]AWL12687.1 putative DNA endonuclease SmrA [Saliniradius amylolyticus]
MKSHDQSNAFSEAMSDVTPLKQDDKVWPSSGDKDSLAKRLKREALERQQQEDANYLRVEAVDPIDPYDFICFKKDGVQEGVYKNLRTGKYPIDTVINLRQQSYDKARQALFEQLRLAHERGIRTLLVHHGLGLQAKPFPGVLKSYVNQWLRQMPEVIAFHTALKAHGGQGATYVLLQKNTVQKQTNRERHAKR